MLFLMHYTIPNTKMTPELLFTWIFKFIINLPENKNGEVKMSRKVRVFLSLFAFILVVVLTGSGCTSLRKTKFHSRKSESFCNLSKLVGPDTYYYSEHYQKKLKKSIRRIGSK
jgi:hypothetical protein